MSVMRKAVLWIIMVVFLLTIGVVETQAASRTATRGPSKKYSKQDKEKEKKVEKVEKEEEEEVEEVEEIPMVEDENAPKRPQDFLLRMLAYESLLGILDYQVEIIEVTKSSATHQTKSIRKNIYYLAPTRQLTMQDGIPIYYIDEFLFQKKMNLVELKRLSDETVNDVDCVVIKMIPLEEGFKKNVKHYYLAKDDYRKIRIESTHVNYNGNERYIVIDYKYRMVDGMFQLPLNTESRMYDEREYLLQTTTSTFTNWRFNTGITAKFFDEKLRDYKLYDVVK